MLLYCVKYFDFEVYASLLPTKKIIRVGQVSSVYTENPLSLTVLCFKNVLCF